MRVIGYHDPRRRIAKLMNKAQRTVNVLEHTDRVRDHDIIEWTVDIGERVRILSILEYEMKVRWRKMFQDNSIRSLTHSHSIGVRGSMSRMMAGFQCATDGALDKYKCNSRADDDGRNVY